MKLPFHVCLLFSYISQVWKPENRNVKIILFAKKKSLWKWIINDYMIIVFFSNIHVYNRETFGILTEILFLSCSFNNVGQCASASITFGKLEFIKKIHSLQAPNNEFRNTSTKSQCQSYLMRRPFQRYCMETPNSQMPTSSMGQINTEMLYNLLY